MTSTTPSPSRLQQVVKSTRSLIRGHKVGSSLAVGSLLLMTVAAVVNSTVDAQSKPSVNIDQCENIAAVCDSSNAGKWINGNLGQNNSNYPEGSSVPFRAVMDDLVVDQTYSLTLEWDTTVNSGDHAFDYLTTFNRTVSTADPCAGVTCSGPTNTLAIPVDPNVTAAGVTQIGGQVFNLRGGEFPANGSSIANVGNLCLTDPCTITANPTSYTLSDPYTQNSSTRIKLYFTAKSTTAVLAWSGHVATQDDWGIGSSAVDIPGSPYHMMLLGFACTNDLHCGTGRQDLSMSSSAVAPIATTTTAAPATTTTVEQTTTTLESTTTTEDPTTTTIEPTTTTVAETTTTVQGETTTTITSDTNPEEFPTTTLTSDTNPEEFPATGANSNQLWWFAATLITLGALVVLTMSTRNRKWH